MNLLMFLSIFCWLYIFSLINVHRGIKWGMRAGGSDPSPPPAPVVQNNAETSKQAIQAQIDAVPQILQTQKKFGPQFQQLALDNLQEFGPQITESTLGLAEEFGPRLSQLTRSEQQVLAPERVAGSDAIAEFLAEGPEDLTDTERDQFLEDIRAAQQTRGLSQSGFGAVDELEKVTGLRQALKDRYLNVALSASGRLPAAGGSSVAAPNTAQQQLVKNVDPSTFFGGQSSVNAAQSSNFGTQGSIFGSQLANQGPGIGGLVGQGIGLFGGGVLTGGAANITSNTPFFG